MSISFTTCSVRPCSSKVSSSSSGASRITSRTRILPFFSRSPIWMISLMAMLEWSTASSTSFSPSSMRLAISTSPSRVSRETDPILRRYMRTGSLDLE